MVTVLGWQLAMFPDASAAAEALKKDIAAAKQDLAARGVDLNTGLVSRERAGSALKSPRGRGNKSGFKKASKKEQ